MLAFCGEGHSATQDVCPLLRPPGPPADLLRRRRHSPPPAGPPGLCRHRPRPRCWTDGDAWKRATGAVLAALPLYHHLCCGREPHRHQGEGAASHQWRRRCVGAGEAGTLRCFAQQTLSQCCTARRCLSPSQAWQTNVLYFNVTGTKATVANVANGSPYSIAIRSCLDEQCSSPVSATATPSGTVVARPPGPAVVVAPSGSLLSQWRVRYINQTGSARPNPALAAF